MFRLRNYVIVDDCQLCTLPIRHSKLSLEPSFTVPTARLRAQLTLHDQQRLILA